MSDVFISYDRDDGPSVRRIVDGLAAEQVPHWWDQHLEDGQNFSLVIEERIESASHVLVTWSANARRSIFVRGEALEALDRGKLIQVLIDKSRLPVPFNALQATFLEGWNGDRQDVRWRKLVTTLLGGDETEAAPDNVGVIAVPAQDLSTKDVMRAGVSSIQRTALWLLPTLLTVLIATGLVLLFVPLPESVPKENILLGLGGSVLVIIGALIALLIQTLLSTLDPPSR